MSIKALLRSTLLFTTANALSAALPLLLLPLLTRIMSPQDYGIVAMFSLYLSALGAFTGMTVNGAIGMRYYDRHEIDLPRYVGSCMSILCFSTMIVFIIIILFKHQISQITALPPRWLLIGVGVSALQFIMLSQLALFQPAKQPGRFALMRIGQTLIDAALSLSFVLTWAIAWEGRLWGLSGAIIITGFLSIITLTKGNWVKWGWHKEDLRHALKFGVPLIPHILGGLLITMGDRFMITNFIDVSTTGIYMVAVQIGLGMQLLGDSLNRAFSPYYIETLKLNDTKKDRIIARCALIYCIALILIALLIGMIIPYILPFLVGEAFQQAGSLIILMAIGQAFAGMYFVASNIIFYANRTAPLAAITLISGLLNLLLSYFFIQLYGVKGAAYAFIIGQFSLFIGSMLFAHYLRPLPWGKALSPTLLMDDLRALKHG